MSVNIITRLLIGGLILGWCGTVYAAKSQDVMTMSDGCPFGLQGRLAIHNIDDNNSYNQPYSGKGASRSTAVSRLTYAGSVAGETFDRNLDGVIDINDVPLGDYDKDGGVLTPPNHDFNNDGTEDADDVEAWLRAMKGVSSRHSDSEWMFHLHSS